MGKCIHTESTAPRFSLTVGPIIFEMEGTFAECLPSLRLQSANYPRFRDKVDILSNRTQKKELMVVGKIKRFTHYMTQRWDLRSLDLSCMHESSIHGSTCTPQPSIQRISDILYIRRLNRLSHLPDIAWRDHLYSLNVRNFSSNLDTCQYWRWICATSRNMVCNLWSNIWLTLTEVSSHHYGTASVPWHPRESITISAEQRAGYGSTGPKNDHKSGGDVGNHRLLRSLVHARWLSVSSHS
jgi:hypothetical protein